MVRPTSTTTRRGPRASNIDDGSTRDDGGTRGYGNNQIFKPGVNPQKIFWPKPEKGQRRAVLDPKKDCSTIFRLLGRPNPDAKGKFEPARYFNDSGLPRRSAFIDRYMVFRLGFGQNSVAFICWDPDEHIGENINNVKFSTPAFALTKFLANKIKGDEQIPKHWVQFADKDKRGEHFISWPKWMYLAHGLIYQRGADEIYEDPLGLAAKEEPVLIDLGLDTGEQIDAILKAPKEQYEDIIESGPFPEGVKASNLYKVVNPIGLDGGVLFYAYPKGTMPLAKQYRRAGAPGFCERVVDEEDTKKGGTFGYQVFSVKEGTNAKGQQIFPAIDAKYHESLWNKLQPEIRDRLLFPTNEEQAVLIAKALKIPEKNTPDIALLEAAWDEFPDWVEAIPADVRKQAKKIKPSEGGTETGEKLKDEERRRKRGKPDDDDEDDDDEPQGEAIDEEDEDDEESTSRTKKLGGARTAARDDDEEDDDSDDEPDDDEDVESDDDSDDADDESDDDDSDEEEDDDSDEEEEEDDDSDEEEEEDDEPPVQTRKPKAATAKAGKAVTVADPPPRAASTKPKNGKTPMKFDEPPAPQKGTKKPKAEPAKATTAAADSAAKKAGQRKSLGELKAIAASGKKLPKKK